MIGLTFQQIQKYENGTNRISASRLWDIAVLLEVPISFFFEDMDQETLERSPRKLWGNAQLAEQLQETTEDPLTKSETLTMIRAYYKNCSEYTKMFVSDCDGNVKRILCLRKKDR